MYALSNTVQVREGAMDVVVAMLADEVWPAARRIPGCLGLSLMCDRGSGRAIATTAWEDRAALRTAAEDAARLRRRVRERIGAGRVEVQEWEIAVLHREHTTGSARTFARVTWVQVDAGRLDELAEYHRTTLVPRIRAVPGALGLSLLVDRDTGTAVRTVSFATRSDLESTRVRASAHPAESAAAVDVDVLDVAEMEVVLAHLRVPETV
jgi:quinol monooxygenase YgiN